MTAPRTQRIRLAAIAVLLCAVLPRPALAAGILRTVLVIDASSSMRATDPKELRKVAAELYVDLSRDGDEIAVTGFDGDARESTDRFIKIAGPADRDDIKRAIRAVGNDGNWTDFTAGLDEARRLLDAAPDEPGDQELVLFLTDGRCDPDPKGPLAEAARAEGAAKRAEQLCQDKVLDTIVPSLAGARLYAVGLSRSAPRAFLEEAGRRSGGEGVATDNAGELPRLFAGVYARLFGSRMLEGPSAETIDIPVDEGALSIDVVVVGPPSLSAQLTDSSGAAVPVDNTNPSEVYHVDNPAYRFFKVMRPSPGTFRLALGGGGKGGRYAILQNLDLYLGFEALPEVVEIGRDVTVRIKLATPGGKIAPLAFLDRHEVSHAVAEAKTGCKDVIKQKTPDQVLKRRADGVFEVRIPARERGEMCFAAAINPGRSGVLTRRADSHVVRIVPPLHLAASEVRFALIKQASEGRAELSMEGSEVGEAILADLTIDGDARGLSLTPASISLDPAGARSFALSLAAGRDAPAGVRSLRLSITPRQPAGYADRAISVDLGLQIVPLTFWERYGRSIQIGAGVLLFLFLLFGFLLPARFRKTTLLHYKDGRDPDLPREGTYPLGTKARAGFYRRARALVGPTGPVRRGGVVELLAGPGGRVLARPLGGAKPREAPPEDAFGGYGEAAEVRLLAGRFRVMEGVRYEMQGTGLTFWITIRR